MRAENMGITKNVLLAMAEENPDGLRALLEEFGEENPRLYKKSVPDIFDDQTGIYSKRYFEGNLLETQVRKAKENRESISYLILDIDHFGEFNKKYDHPTGDLVIDHVVKTMINCLRTKDNLVYSGREKDFVGVVGKDNEEIPACGRVGSGEEFAAILYGADLVDSYRIAERIRNAIEKTKVETKYGELGVTVSIGVAELKDSTTSLIADADHALLKAKEAGRNRTYLAVNIFEKQPLMKYMA